MTRKGYTIVEMLVVIGTFFFLSVPIASLHIITLRDIPRAYNMIQTNTTILNALKYIKKDVNTATGFPSSCDQYQLNDQTLLIQTNQDVIVYQFKEDQIIRLKCDNDPVKSPKDTIIWPTPKAKIQWHLRNQNNLHALEIKTHIEHKSGRAIDKKMKNSYLFFANALYMSGDEK
jgi:type II secretory pathway component PulJ